ncbi:chemotaxis protein CheA [Teredinibacter sp. KSP-S5-2]|uniref:chemotaxis protein CheA n=1 Tax=Teredinibacter sp. KSP-S5-2 TaxID=3034506 RepID=UPI002934EDEF|nr:chemotaxis protein CheA [Teredinibacter sp. KSP-S5-2]WNO10182.1 chemotaxis protein CheA [Teredinibacter sp. KSP-S5-2]
MSMDAALNAFLAEAEELLDVLEHAFMKISDGSQDSEVLNEVFRAAHTIKGSAGLFGLNDIVGFTHIVENVLDKARDNEIELDDDLVSVLLHCKDHIAELVANVSDQTSLSDAQSLRGEELVGKLRVYLDSDSSESAGSDENSTACSGCWHISVRINQDALKNGMDPVAMIRYLESLGEIQYALVVDDLLDCNSFDPEILYIGFEFGLSASCTKSDIEDAFMFVADESDIVVLEPGSDRKQYLALLDKLESSDELKRLLMEHGLLESDKVNTSKKAKKENNSPHKQESKQLESKKNTTKFVRVDAERLDNLINLIGELVINRQRVDTISERMKDQLLDESVESLRYLTEKVRDAALELRMVPIGETFQRFKRVVRDTAADLNKKITLELDGQETELDRSMVEKLTDPLTHIVRNAIDHGIESPDVREENGKDAHGMLKLSAYHDSGNIVIEVRDDGRGLNTDKIYEKAVEKGILDKKQSYSRKEIHNCIFHAGFSTAQSVTNLSGRGVGMDVVRRNIEELQGGVEVESEEGQGTVLTIRLPLTLAIIDGFHVKVRGTNFIVPQSTLVECININSVSKSKGGNSFKLRGELVPYIELAEVFAVQGKNTDHSDFVVVQFGVDRAGIVVDELIGETQTVIKPLSPIFQSLRGIGGYSLLGSGDIAFILDIPQLISFVVQKENKFTGADVRTA